MYFLINFPDTWSRENISGWHITRRSASYRWPLSLTRARCSLDSDSITRGKFRRPRNRIDEPSRDPDAGARWIRWTRWWRKKKGGGRNLWAIATKEYMELVTVISHVSSRASAVSFRHVSWNHEFDSRPSLLPRECVSLSVCIASR